MAKIIHNLLDEVKTYGGMFMPAESSYNIPEEELAGFQNDPKVYAGLSANPPTVAIEDSESLGQLTGVEGIKFLQKVVITVIQDDSQLTADSKIQKVSMHKAEGSSTTRASHDWTDKCTWYTGSVRIDDETLDNGGSGLVYSSANTHWIDAQHGRLYMEDNLPQYYCKAYDNGVELTQDEDYTVNFESGEITLDAGYTVTGPITADYSYATNSEFILAPDANKQIILEHAELQVSEDVMMNSPIRFVIWVYNPYFNPQAAIVEWTPESQFGVDNFLKFPYKTIRYKNIKDIINGSNLGQGFIPKCSGLANNVLIFPFNYVTLQTLKSSQGAELRLSIDGDTPMGGEWGTVTFYIISEGE